MFWGDILFVTLLRVGAPNFSLLCEHFDAALESSFNVGSGFFELIIIAGDHDYDAVYLAVVEFLTLSPEYLVSL